MSAQLITCPNCGHTFEPEDSVKKELQREFRQKYDEALLKKQRQFEDEQKRQESEHAEQLRKLVEQKEILSRQQQQKELDFEQRLIQERQKVLDEAKAALSKAISSEYEQKLKLQQEQLQDFQQKLQSAQQAELELIRKQQELETKAKSLDIELEKRLLEERTRITEQIRQEEKQLLSNKETEYQFRLKEMEEKLEAQKRLAEEMKRKAEQGSMQLQGEVQELALEELLRSAFPFDQVGEVGKGVKGADCIQTVRNSFGQECGRIMYESKRTQHFANDWIEKLKKDQRSHAADIAVIVTQAMPKDMKHFGMVDGVWVCSFSEVRALAGVLREGILKVYQATRSQENKGDKMQLLYDYLTSNEFAEQWKAIREGFLQMKMSIQKEREAMEKLWKAREKQLEKVLLSAVHIQGSVEGIAGADALRLELTDGEE